MAKVIVIDNNNNNNNNKNNTAMACATSYLYLKYFTSLLLH